MISLCLPQSHTFNSPYTYFSSCSYTLNNNCWYFGILFFFLSFWNLVFFIRMCLCVCVFQWIPWDFMNFGLFRVLLPLPILFRLFFLKFFFFSTQNTFQAKQSSAAHSNNQTQTLTESQINGYFIYNFFLLFRLLLSFLRYLFIWLKYHKILFRMV